MSAGGIYDHLGGGFARYSTDAEWLVPHFEKMLYDNAQLLRLYAEAYHVFLEAGERTFSARCSEVIAETHGWLERELRDLAGGLYAAMDADSEGVEGKYFVFSPEEVGAVLDTETARLFCRYYDVKPGGNWRDPHGHGPVGKSILHLMEPPEDEAVAARLREARQKLLAARRERIPPSTDDKVLCGWNGLGISGLAEAGRLLHEPRYVEAARRTADFILSHMRDANGQLLRTFKGGVAKLPATLDDYAFLCEGLFYLAHATQNLSYLTTMRELMDALLRDFYDPAERLFYLGPKESAGVKLCTRPVSLHDTAIPSGVSVACMNLLRLAALVDTGDSERYQSIAEKTLLHLSEQVLRNPLGLSNLVAALDLLQNGLTTVVIAGEDGGALRAATASRYVPDLFVLVCGSEGVLDSRPPWPSDPSGPLGSPLRSDDGWNHLRRDKYAQKGQAAAYVCRGPRCSAPITDPLDLTARLLNP
jgi:uncharacterized protein YyaL (SSP411 family)